MDYDIIIIGAGVVGLAIANELSKQPNRLAILDKNKNFGQETSSRNSEVIHSGIYYPKNSLKSNLCISGQKLLYEYCDKKGILYKKCGKYIIATNNDEIKQIEEILENAKENGVKHCRIIGKKEIQKKEPNVKAEKAIFFPESGIIDSHSLMKNIETDIIAKGVDVAYNSEVINIEKIDNGYKISVIEDQGVFNFTSKIVINAAGLFADKVSKMVGLNILEYEIQFWKGEYFAVGNGKNKLVNSLIYPVPNANISLGIHGTIDLSGGLKLGPNAVFLFDKEINYKVNENSLNEFYKSVKHFFPFLEKKDLHPDQAGIRPKLNSKNGEIVDFIIKNEDKKGYKNFINLIGIESPGLTACLSIAKYVKKIIL